MEEIEIELRRAKTMVDLLNRSLQTLHLGTHAEAVVDNRERWVNRVRQLEQAKKELEAILNEPSSP